MGSRLTGNHAYGFFLQTEDGTHHENRVIAASGATQGLPVLDYDSARTPAAANEHRQLVRRFRNALLRAGMIAFSERVGIAGTAHVSGTLKLGGDYLKLEQFVVPRGRPIPVDSKSNDRWFQHIAIIVTDMDRAFAWLSAQHVEYASAEPQLLPQWNPNAGGISAFYFRDPDGHNLEILHFPPGKGNAKWQAPSDRMFLGIDHSAIVVVDTDASLRFYHDTLGLKVAGGSENYGIEQERLSNVFGARLRITALRAESGPGIELLEYLAPRSGRSMPIDTQSNDLWSWHIDMTADVAAADAAVRGRHFVYISPGPIHSNQGDRQWSLMLRDPDGHATMLESR